MGANRVTTLDLRLEVGLAEPGIDVSAQSGDLLVKDSPLRRGSFLPREVRDLPLVSSCRTIHREATGKQLAGTSGILST